MNLESLRTFVLVVEHGGFSHAAEAMRVAKSTVSQRVRELEQSLGTPLLQRSTRKMSLTAAGEELFARGHEILGAALEAELAVSQLSAEAVGELRISAPVSFGQRYLGRVVSRLLLEHPRLQVAVDLNDRDVDLIEERYSFALRVGRVREPNLVAQRVGTTRHRVVASPSYLERAGRPRTPEDLRAHECLLYAHQRDPDTWSFEGPEGPTSVRVQGRFRANHGDLLADAAIAGAGLAWLPDFITAEARRRGELVGVLEERCVSLSPIQIVSTERRLRPLKARIFIEALRESLGEFNETNQS